MKPTHLFALMALLAISCNDKKDVTTKPKAVAASNTKFPEVKDLSQFKETDFVLTPQSPLHERRNAIYSPTMLYAWNEIKDLAAGDVHVDSKYTDLALLNYSKSFLNSLHPEEYKTDITMENGLITMTAEFSKSLPFEKMFDNFSGLLQFKGQKVQSFGCNGDDYELMKSVEILHYKNDSDFIVKLSFKDTQHEMLLCMAKEKPTTLEALFKHIEAKTKTGKTDKVKNRLNYSMNGYDDELMIPKLSFNIENDYKKLVDNKFLADNGHFRIKKAWQRTAFVLNESGAAAESEALMTADSLGVEEEKPRPKKLYFNKPFLVMLKRKDSPNPYFALWVENTELMKKE